YTVHRSRDTSQGSGAKSWRIPLSASRYDRSRRPQPSMVAAPCTPMQPNVGGALVASESITSSLLMKSLSQNSPGTGFTDRVFALSSCPCAALVPAQCWPCLDNGGILVVLPPVDSHPCWTSPKVAITLYYRYQPPARAPIDAGELVADTRKVSDYRDILFLP